MNHKTHLTRRDRMALARAALVGILGGAARAVVAWLLIQLGQ
ncbi:hypothetical protein BX285_4532 [Streptomyces sp. 1114.5]|nr:hypothetical protein BX285_4532 [Streptomyces sp. 1114.5]